MAVVYYQLGIIATIWITHRVRPDYALWVAVAWSVETLFLLSYPPLIIIQLGLAWGTYFALRATTAKAQRIEDLENQLRDHPAETRERLRRLAASDLKFISGKAHRDLLLDSVEAAQDSLCILSGWISDKVVCGELMHRFEAALERGVRVSIGYGHRDSQGKHSDWGTTKRALRNLKELQQTARDAYPGELLIGEFPNHEKILVQDDEVVACGSNNWLSNSRFGNSERTVLVRNASVVRTERERVIQ